MTHSCYKCSKAETVRRPKANRNGNKIRIQIVNNFLFQTDRARKIK